MLFRSYIPALSEVLPHAEGNGFHVTDVEILRSHYARTLREWSDRFERNREAARELYGEEFCRMWELYLLLSEASFEHLGNMVFQLQLATRPNLVPVTRDYLLAPPAFASASRERRSARSASARRRRAAISAVKIGRAHV